MSAISPHGLLKQLKDLGIELKMRGNSLTGPTRAMTPEQRKLVSDNKAGLIVALTYQCPTCDSPVRIYDREPRNYFALECSNDPLHYSEIVKKKPGVLGLNVPLEEAIETDLQEELGW